MLEVLITFSFFNRDRREDNITELSIYTRDSIIFSNTSIVYNNNNRCE
jgi:hypothetical protein